MYPIRDIKTEMERMPAALRIVLEAELAAGNEIKALRYGFPAAPVGVSFLLARPMTQKLPERGPGITCYNRNGSDYGGEVTDKDRHFFLLEPASPRKAEDPPKPSPKKKRPAKAAKASRPEALSLPSWAPFARFLPSECVSRFKNSMNIDYDKWKEGIGYDMEAISEASPEDLQAIESLVIHRTMEWREVEALAAIDSPAAREALRRGLLHGNAEVKSAILRHAPGLVSSDEKTVALVGALATAEVFGGLSSTLLEVEEHHPPEVIDALLRGTLSREDGTAVHYAAMLFYLHGKAKEAFDWEHRDFFLKFLSKEPKEREQLFRILCERIGVDPTRFLH